MWDIENEKSYANPEALVAVYKPIVQGFSLSLGLYYGLLSMAHIAVLKGEVALIMSLIAGLTAATFMFVRFTLFRYVTKIETMECAMFCLSTLLIFNVTAHSYLAKDPAQFVYLLMYSFCAAMFGPTQRTVGATLFVLASAGVFLTIQGPPGNIVNNIFTGIVAIWGGFASGTFLHKTIRAQVDARALSEALVTTLGIEGQRNKDLAHQAEVANFAKADFLANMSHELRTPLNGVVGIAHALAATDLSKQQQEMVELIESSGTMLTRLLSDILDFSKIEAGKIDIERAPFDLRDEINATAFLLKGRAEEKGLHFHVTFSHDADGWMAGDATRIKQVIANLTSNAVKFTNSGGISVNIDWTSSNEILTIEVVDTGIGFDGEVGKRLFNRFVQADTSITRRFGGTGLGLSICRGLVDAMGGGMDWKSVPGVGSTFIVRLPAPRCQAPAKVMPKCPSDTIASGATVPGEEKIRILVAEDHITNQRVLSLMLEPLGIELVMCENGALALDMYKRQAFDVVLMDMQMPEMDGLAATRAIRAFESERKVARTPIIMLTANAMRQHRIDAKIAGADLHVAKPFTAATLIGAIQDCLSSLDDALETDITDQAKSG